MGQPRPLAEPRSAQSACLLLGMVGVAGLSAALAAPSSTITLAFLAAEIVLTWATMMRLCRAAAATAVRDASPPASHPAVERTSTPGLDRLEPYRAAFDRTASFLWIIGTDGRLVDANRAALDFAGALRSDVVGRSIWETPWWSGDPVARERVRIAVAAAVRGRFARSRLDLVGEEGAVAQVEFSLQALRGADGAPSILVGEGVDVGDRDRIERERDDALRALQKSQGRVERLRSKTREVERARDHAIEATRSKSRFLANMSHEVRTPMNGIVGMCELLESTRLTPTQTDYAAGIRQSADALLTVIDDILVLSRIEAGKLSLVEVDFDLGAVVEDVADLLAPRAQQKGLEICTEIPPCFPDGLLGDPVRFRQVLLNLANNAVKFTEVGEVVLSLAAVRERANSVVVRIEVRDTGVGIPESEHDAVFESFHQVAPSPESLASGTGLGLSISRALVGLMGGRLTLESEPGGGCKFIVEVTLARTPRDGEDAAGAGACPMPLRGERVLVASRHTAVRASLAAHLAAWGCRVETATTLDNVFTSLESARGVEPFGAILLDQNMLDSPADVAARVRECGGSPEPRLVRLRPRGDRPCPSDGDREGDPFQATLLKPLRRTQVLGALHSVLGRAGGVPEPIPPARCRKPVVLPIHVLLADDNDVNRLVAVRMLEMWGCRARAVRNGREAVEAVLDSADDPYDLVLMDVQMPLLDGFAATGEIRNYEQGPTFLRRVPIVAMTAHAMQGDRERCLAAGMDGYLAKPVRPDDLLATLLDWGPRVADPVAPVHVTDASAVDAAARFLPEDLRDGCGEDRSMQEEVVQLFLDETARAVGALGQAFREGRLADARRLAHSLRGSSLVVGARRLADLCTRLETRIQAGAVAVELEAVAALDAEWTALRATLESFLGEAGRATNARVVGAET